MLKINELETLFDVVTMENEVISSQVKKVLKIPAESEFLSLCSSFTQYTGKKIKINFLEKPVKANKFIETIYDEYVMHFTNTNDMNVCLTGLMYADLKEKIHTSDLSRSERINQGDSGNSLSV